MPPDAHPQESSKGAKHTEFLIRIKTGFLYTGKAIAMGNQHHFIIC